MATSSQGAQKDAPKIKKEADFVVYRLLDEHKNKKRRRGADPEYPPYFSIPNTSIIKWKKGDTWTTRKLQYLEGYHTIFADEQKDVPKEDLRNIRNKPVFHFGEIRIPAYNKPLIDFLDLCSMNEGSENRRDNVPAIFKRVDEMKDKKQEMELMRKRLDALNIATNSKEEDMLVHAEYLNIPLVDSATGSERDLELIRLEYQKVAQDKPVLFMESVNNPKMRTVALVKRAISDGHIYFDKGIAKWSTSKAIITTIPSDKERVEFLADFTYTDDGASFAATLKSL